MFLTISSTNFDNLWEKQFFDFVYLLLDHVAYTYIICIRTHDTGCSFEPIFMKFTWLVRLHSWVNPIVLETIGPIEPQIWGKCTPKPIFWGLNRTVWGFLRKKIFIRYPIFHTKGYIHLRRSMAHSLKNDHAAQK